MKKFRNSFFYIGVIGGFSALMFWIVVLGEKLEDGRDIVAVESQNSQWTEFINSLVYNFEHPLAILLLQIVTIIVVARLFGWLCQKIGQPSVIGEILAGIILGPSLLGMYFPGFFDTLFPTESLANLQFLSQIGLILFMFVVGMELELKVLKNQAHDAVVISHASIIIPFSLGMGLAYLIYQSFAPADVAFLSFGLFLGIAMSITAFPVLARIVQERGLHKSRLGTVVVTCAAADDITAWCLLAAVIAIVKAGSFVSSLYIIALATGYVYLMVKFVRPFLKRVGDLHTSRENLSKPIVAIFFLTLIISSYATEVIGIHALFGAFMAGAIMPENVKFRNIFIEKVEDVALVLLLPLFFVFTGLRTQIGLLNDAYLWKVTALIIVVAVVGKFFGSALAAKFVGQNWKDSLSIGALMNTRGLMELVVLNIGYDLGVLTPEIFAMMVIMALVTTLMTGPALDIIHWGFDSKSVEIPLEVNHNSKYRILLSFGDPQRGKSLLRLAHGLIKNLQGNAAVTAMHLSPSEELHHYNIKEYERENFAPVIEEARHLHQKINTLFKPSSNIDADITEVANEGDYDLLLVGIGHSIFEGSLLGRILEFTTQLVNPGRLINQVTRRKNQNENSIFDERTSMILSMSEVPVGVLIDKGLKQTDQIFMPFFSEKDAFLMTYVQKLINNSGSQVTTLDFTGQIDSFPAIKRAIQSIEQIASNHISLVSDKNIGREFLTNQHLMLISLDGWKELVNTENEWLTYLPSTLIMSDKNNY